MQNTFYWIVGAGFVFSILFLVLLIRTALGKSKLNFSTTIILSLMIIFWIVLLGDSHFLSLVQSIIILFVCLIGLILFLKKKEFKDIGGVALFTILIVLAMSIDQISRFYSPSFMKSFSKPKIGEVVNVNSVLNEKILDIDSRLKDIEKKFQEGWIPPSSSVIVANSEFKIKLGEKRKFINENYEFYFGRGALIFSPTYIKLIDLVNGDNAILYRQINDESVGWQSEVTITDQGQSKRIRITILQFEDSNALIRVRVI